MSFKEFEIKVEEIEAEIKKIRDENAYSAPILISQLEKNIFDLLIEAKQCITPADRVYLARHQGRPSATDYIEALFDDFLPLCGDRQCADDKSIIGGLATYCGVPVTVIGHRKGKNLDENLKFNFGMPNPEGYRKALRLMQQAEKFGRPIITFVDTPGAYPGIEAEARGQGEAIAKCLAVMSNVEVPVISVVIGEGGSGGALAISVADRLIMLENSVYSVLSPEGFASILWKDSSKSAEACEIMKLTANDLLTFGIADRVVSEPLGGAHRAPKEMFSLLDEVLKKEFFSLKKQSGSALAANRYKKLRKIGEFSER